MTDNTTETTVRRKKRRSPSYPAVALADAIEKARTLWERDGRDPIALPVALDHLGYSAKSGPGSTAIAALKKYGLIDYTGKGDDRRVQLTQAALDILWGEEDQTEDRARAIRKAALAPEIFQELWRDFDWTTPTSEGQLKIYLRNKGFAEVALADVILNFRATVDYANLLAADTLEPPDDRLGEDMTLNDEHGSTSVLDRHDHSRTTSTQPASRTYRVPLTRNREAVIQVPRPMDDAAWEQMMAVLNAMKPGILTDDTDQ